MFESKFMTCNNRRLELGAEVISSILNLSAQSRLQFLHTKALTSVSKGRRVGGHHHQGGPLPTAQSCLPWPALPKEIVKLLCKAGKSQHQNLLPLKSNPTGLSFWKSLLWIHLSFFSSDCKDKGVLFLIPTETVGASLFTTHGGWTRVSVRGQPFPAQIIILAKVDPCHIGDFCSLSPIASLWTLLKNRSPSLTLQLPSGHTQQGYLCFSNLFLLFLAWVFPCAKPSLGVANLNQEKQFWNQPWSLKATSSKFTHMREQINLKLVNSLSLI